ncbi:hypothetical protein niasHT_012049 [Heterodera trifolii]|uniref:Cyclin B n=1 Tax=Heterodera trifolii TaxID=157864 RepID=A0ABD2KTN5_9BILA
MTSSLLQQPMRSKNVCPYKARQLGRDSVARVHCNEKDGESGKRQNIEKPWSSLKFGGGTTLFPTEYADDVDLYMRQLERRSPLDSDFLSGHKTVDGRMRQILVDWLVYVQVRLKLTIETLSLSVHILDRSLLALPGINKTNMQLLGVTCIFIAAKFEELVKPNVDDFVYLAANMFKGEHIMRMEPRVLSGLKFNLSVPYAVQFLHRYRFYTSPSMSVWAFAKFISEVANVCYPLAHFPPSVVAAVSLNLAAFAYGCPLQSPELFVNVFRMSEAAVERISRSFVDHVIQFLDPTAKLGALREKYRRHFVITNEQLALLRDFGDHLRKPNNGLLDVPR